MSRTPSIVLALRYTNTSPSESKCGCGLSHHVCVDVCAPDKRKRPTSLMYARATVVGKLTGEMLRLADRRATSAPEMQDIDQIENHMRDLRETFSKRGIARCNFSTVGRGNLHLKCVFVLHARKPEHLDHSPQTHSGNTKHLRCSLQTHKCSQIRTWCRRVRREGPVVTQACLQPRANNCA